jgi:hypothetical protein
VVVTGPLGRWEDLDSKRRMSDLLKRDDKIWLSRHYELAGTPWEDRPFYPFIPPSGTSGISKGKEGGR